MNSNLNSSYENLEILNQVINPITNSNLNQRIKDDKDLNKEEFFLENKNKKKKSFEISSIKFHLNGIDSRLYLLKDLTNFKKINGLKAKKKYQRVYFASITHDFRTPL